jgi:acetolactate synthase-1/2/3 large subunit
MPHQHLAQELPVSDAIIQALAEGGVRYVFGMPGGLTSPLWKSLFEHPTIRVVQTREESIGAIMAEAHGRMTGSPAVVMGQGEWIAGNAGQGLLEALLGSSPVVVLTEMSDGGQLSHHAPYQSGTGDHGNWDAVGALRGVTKRVMVSYSPAQAVQHTQLAIKHSLVGDPGPVAVVYHGSSLKGTVGPQSVPRIYPTGVYLVPAGKSVDESQLRLAADAVTRASRPVIIAGNGVRLAGAHAALRRLATATGAPVATSSGGKGVFDETSDLSVGVVGTFGRTEASAVVGGADLVIAVGTKLAPTDTLDESPFLLDPGRQTMVQIDVDPLNAAWTFPMDHVLIGDAGYVMDRLADVVEGKRPERLGQARASVAESRHAHQAPAETAAEAAPFSPRAVISLLDRTYPADGVVTCDAGENRLFMMQWFRSKEGGEYLQPAAGGGMGYSVPSALAAKLVHHDRPVLAVCGDGGFAMCIHALMTAVQEELPVGVLVLNNGALGWVLHGMGSRAVAANFAEFDHAAIARSIGCDGVSVSTWDELTTAITGLADLSRPTVVDVPVSLSISFRDVAQRLEGPGLPKRRS